MIDANVFVHGAGPRWRALTLARVAETLPAAAVHGYESRAAALAHAARISTPALLLDARVAFDPNALETLLAAGGEGLRASGRSPSGRSDPREAALAAADGPRLAAAAGEPLPARLAVGIWTDGEPAFLPPSGESRAVTVHADGWGLSGYAVAARRLMLGMRQNGLDVAWQADVAEEHRADMAESDRAELARLRTVRPDPAAPSVVYYPPTLDDGRPRLDVYRDVLASGPLIAATMFESDGLPARWVAPLNRCDGVWVPSAFNAESFARAGVRRHKLRVVPIGLELSAYDPDGPALALPERRSTVFASVFEWRKRKGYDVLLRAWAQAFCADDDVMLYLRTGFKGLEVLTALREECARLGLDSRRLAPVRILPEPLSNADLAAFYRAADAFVLPSRGEAFGMPYMEAMALGVPVIATGFGGSADFLDARCSYPIPATRVAVDAAYARRFPMYAGQHWAEPDVDATADALRSVAQDRAHAATIAARGFARIRAGFNRERAGEVAAEALAELKPAPKRSPAAGGIAEYIGIATSLAGYGSEARGFLSALAAVDLPVALRNASYEDEPGLIRQDEARTIRRLETLEPLPNAPVIWHLMPTQIQALAPGRMNVVRTMEETDGLAADWPAACNRFDRVWVPSAFNADTFERAGVDPRKLRILPGAIDTDFWAPGWGGLAVGAPHTFRFLSIFDWMARKGWDVLLRAFARVFTASDDVSLTIKTTNLVARATGKAFAPQSEVEAFWQREFPARVRAGTLPRVYVMEERATEVQLAQLYGSHDAYVGPSRAEGWGRAHFEAMACGMPTIGTRWGGSLAFMNDENSYLVEVEKLVPAQGDTDRYLGRNWAEPSVEHLETLLRRVVERPAEARERGASARRDMVARFSLPAVGELLAERIAEIAPLRTGSIAAYAPEPQTELAVIVDARDATPVASALERLEATTRSLYDARLWTAGPLAAVLGEMAPTTYVAVVPASVATGPAWDRFLIEALRSRPRARFAVPRNAGSDPLGLGVPERAVEPADAERFGQWALEQGIELYGVGTYVRGVPAGVVVAERALFEGASAPQSLPPETLGWVAYDAYAKPLSPALPVTARR